MRKGDLGATNKCGRLLSRAVGKGSSSGKERRAPGNTRGVYRAVAVPERSRPRREWVSGFQEADCEQEARRKAETGTGLSNWAALARAVWFCVVGEKPHCHRRDLYER